MKVDETCHDPDFIMIRSFFKVNLSMLHMVQLGVGCMEEKSFREGNNDSKACCK
jgi:hypothetical protein